MSNRLSRLGFARTRVMELSDTCTVTPDVMFPDGRTEFTCPCAVFTPTLKLGHGYGHEGGGPTIASRRVTKSIIFDRDVVIQSGDNILWVEEGVNFVAGEPSTPSTLEPTVMVSCTVLE